MNILFYISTLCGGGAARVMVNLANRFAKDGSEVTIVTNLNDTPTYPLDNNVKTLHIDNKSIEGSFIRRNIHRIVKLRRLIKRLSPDCIISFMTENNIRCLFASLHLDVKTFTSVRSDPIHECGKGIHGWIIRKCYELSDGVICQTEEALKWFTDKTQKKGTVILNQIDDQYFSTVKQDVEKKAVITAGRFVPAKNHRLLINAFSDIADKTNENLIIYGEGPLEDEYKDLIKELKIESRVFLPGKVKDMISCYDMAKLFVLSSDYEGLPNVLMEAMVREVPCISTDCPCGGPRLLLDNGLYGELIPVNGRKELASKMLKLIEDDSIREEYSKKLSIKKNDFRADKVFLQWKKYIKEKR